MGYHRSQLPQAGQAGPGYLQVLTVSVFQTGQYVPHQIFFLLCQSYYGSAGIMG